MGKIWVQAQKTRDADFLDFLCALLENNGRAIKSNQDDVCDVIMGVRGGNLNSVSNFLPNFFDVGWHTVEKEWIMAGAAGNTLTLCSARLYTNCPPNRHAI
jgi:hypothetical protein